MSLSDELKRAATPAAATQEREALWRLEIRSLKREVQKLLRDLSMSEDAREGALQAAAEREQELESRQQELTAQQIGLNHHYEGWQRGAAELRAQRDAWAARHRQTSRSLQLLQQQQCTWERELHLAETNLQRLAVRLAASQRREARYTEREQELEELLAEQIAQTASLQRKSRRLERGWVRDSQRLSAEVAQEKARADEACDALAERPRRPSWRP